MYHKEHVRRQEAYLLKLFDDSKVLDREITVEYAVRENGDTSERRSARRGSPGPRGSYRSRGSPTNRRGSPVYDRYQRLAYSNKDYLFSWMVGLSMLPCLVMSGIFCVFVSCLLFEVFSRSPFMVRSCYFSVVHHQPGTGAGPLITVHTPRVDRQLFQNLLTHFKVKTQRPPTPTLFSFWLLRETGFQLHSKHLNV